MSETDALFERLWHGEAGLEDWTRAVAGGSLDEVADGIAAVSTGYLFGNVTAIRTGEGLVLIDTGSRETAHQTLAALRKWDERPVHTVIYTHGHIDHTWGARLLDEEADRTGVPRPHIVAHRNVLKRFDRYDRTHSLNTFVMGRQFNQPDYTFPTDHRRPDQVYDESLSLRVGGVQFELNHGRGETDDATFVWLPQTKVLVSGDFVIWVFPNAGNPRKVQRYAPDWATVLGYMRDLSPDVLIPGHGPAVKDRTRAAQVLGDGARILDDITSQTVALMNQGCDLNTILQRVRAPADLLSKPYLRPRYDDPAFVARSIWHLYAGWYDGNPSHLKPVADAELGAEIAALAGGVERLAERAERLNAQGQPYLAAALIEFAVAASPDEKDIHRIRAEIYGSCVGAETSLIGKALFSVPMRDSQKNTAG
jgi:alkyl sulfatase BDS1-like metallo-beta-lactamase superfamily hydrolase